MYNDWVPMYTKTCNQARVAATVGGTGTVLFSLPEAATKTVSTRGVLNAQGGTQDPNPGNGAHAVRAAGYARAGRGRTGYVPVI